MPKPGALVEFRVLGPVEVRVNGQPVNSGHARQRAVLAALLLDLGRVVSAEQVIDRVWGEAPPASVRNVLYGYIARLRAVLAGAGDPDVSLARQPGGYQLRADEDRLDLCRFRRQVAGAAAAAGDDERVAALLRSALSLWHGPPLAGLSSPWLSGMRETLRLQRIAAVLDLNDIALRQGQHSSLISELAEEAAEYPADERLIGQLMLALYRSDRQAEALRWFERIRRQLAEEFGADPSTALQVLHQQILRTDPSLTLSRQPAPRSAPALPAPRELPADVSAFTGRAAELAELDRLLPAPVPGNGPAAGTGAPATKVTAIVISAVSGTAGVGKTALAVHWARRAAGHFPDGQLYVNLRGYDPGQPMVATDALAGFLRALGVAGQDIPPGPGERAARYRSLLAGRRMLVVLDNAAEVEQVRPLLPGDPACVTVVTSRHSLAGLVARDGARRLDLDLMPLGDAVGLLRALIGGRVDADSAAATTLAAQCSRLPLALRVAAELAVARPTVPLADLVGDLADQQQRLHLLNADGDPRTAVRAVFSWSCRHLDADAARAFRLAGLHPGPDLDPYAAAALTGSTTEHAGLRLDQLAGAQLMHLAGPGRYGLHDLLRAYARELTAQDGEQERHAALTRLFDYYLHAAASAMDALFPAEQHRRPDIPPSATPSPPLTDPAAARAWLDTERASLVAMAEQTAEHGWPGHAAQLAATLFRYLDTGGHYPEAVTIHSCARSAGQRTGDRAAEATAAYSLGTIDARQGRYQQAARHFRQAVALFREAGDRAGEARPSWGLGSIEFLQGRYQQAARHFRRAVALFREAGDRTGEARGLTDLSLIDLRQGRYEQAADYLRQSLGLLRQVGDRVGEAYALANLGDTALRQGHYHQATDHLGRALALFLEVGDRSGEGYALATLGDLHLRQGDCQQAVSRYRQALAVFRQTGDQAGEAVALNGLGDALRATGQPGQARVQHGTALALADQIGDQSQLAHAHDGLAHSYQVTGDPGQARHHWQEALTLYTALGAPEADEVRAQLTAILAASPGVTLLP